MKINPDYKSRFRILKGGKIALVITALIGSITMLSAAPSDGVVTTGTATISQTPNTTTITQSTQKASINWQSFSIASNETVNFVQPSSSSVTLNRVIGNSASTIAGNMNANGQVFLLNPNGVIFTKGSQVNVGALVASTLNMSDTDFNNGNYVLSGSSSVSVLNQGDITTANGGYVVFAAKSVTNEGTITSQEGNVQLASGEQISLNINGNSLLSLTIDKGTYDSLVSNKGIIQADGGSVYLTSQAMDSVLSGVVNNSGVIEAQSIGTKDGKIVLFAHGGSIHAGGTLDTGAGTGFIETSGEVFSSDDTLHVTTGEWLIDPVDLIIDSTLASTISTTLNGGADVTQSATNDITVSAPISWSSNILTLDAGNNININTQLDLTSTAGLFLKYAQTTSSGTYNVYAPVNIASTGSFSTQHASDTVVNYTIISDATALQNINSGLSGKYALGSNIDASSIANFVPLGKISTPFTGKFDGLGHAIDKLTVNSSDLLTDVGLFGDISGATIENLGLTNIDITSTNNYSVGGLVGFMNNASTIKKSYVDGGIIRNTNANNGTGGFVGQIYDAASNISESFANVAIVNTNTIQNVGGFVGENGGVIKDSYALGSIDNADYTGGFVGWNSNENQTSTGSIINSYANVTITNSTHTGGFDENSDTKANFTNCYFNTATGLTDNNPGVSGLSSAQMQQHSNFAGFDFTNTWIGYDGHTAPLLRAFMVPLTVTANDVTTTYNGTAQSATGVSYSIASPNSLLLGSVGYTFGTNSVTNTAGDHTNAGNVAITPSGYYSTQQVGGYAVSFVDGTMTINKKAISISGLSADNKVYDGTTNVNISNWGNVSTGVGTETLTLNHGTASFSDQNVATAKIVTATGYSLADGTNGGVASNYTLSSSSTTATADITAKVLTINGLTADNKVYDGTTNVNISNWGNVSTGVGTETLTLNHGTASFSDQNVATAKTVTAIDYSLADGTNGGVASNYTLSSSSTTATADITAAASPVTNPVTTPTANLSMQNLLANIYNIKEPDDMNKQNKNIYRLNNYQYLSSGLEKIFYIGDILIINRMPDIINNLRLEGKENQFSIKGASL
ncbi:filamentous hemagglutinin N-terminal domain-containing protein [Sulfurimonas crateris]|uniref:Filamentous hemagglutinin N-terminal domain-containing protein n=1 Tax=Sulfurimonas crateris TaxID=2574727 RepID=A0A4U2Z812_9BACT|nr:YDG domain-containing protein [Sulfurimonas crateris]TKI70427.1 filamentous hemagglutinin N-terminal domain-containing protein [Sulfurimonas crateris]